MPSFDSKSCQRIQDVVLQVESTTVDGQFSLPEGRMGSPWRWFLLTECFGSSTHEAAAKLGTWSASANGGDGELTAAATAEFTIRDTTETGAAGDGDWVRARPLGSENGQVWELVGNDGGAKFATLNGDLLTGGSAEASILSGAPLADSGNDATVYDCFLEAGMKLASGARVMLTPQSGRWYVTQSNTCPVAQ